MQNHDDILYKLLNHILIEIREEAHNIGSKKIFHLSDLIHNIPMKLKDSDGNVREKLLKDIEEEADRKGVSKWLENVLKQL